MGQIDDGLRQLLAVDVIHLIQQQRQNNGHAGGQHQLDDAQLNGIGEGRPEVGHGEKTLEVLQTNPHRSLDDVVLGEGEVDAEHRQVVEDNQENQDRDEHEIEASILLHARQQGLLLGLIAHSAVHAMTSLDLFSENVVGGQGRMIASLP